MRSGSSSFSLAKLRSRSWFTRGEISIQGCGLGIQTRNWDVEKKGGGGGNNAKLNNSSTEHHFDAIFFTKIDIPFLLLIFDKMCLSPFGVAGKQKPYPM